MDLDRIARLTEFDTPTVANGLEMLAVRDPSYGYTGPDVRCLMPELGPRVGVAVTARMDTTSPERETKQPTHPKVFYEWLRHIQDVARAHTNGHATLPVFAVIESVGLRPRYTVSIGDGMGTQLTMAGVAGYLTNGCIRDLDGVRAVPLPCWAAGISPMHGAIRWLDVGTPVVIDGMTVRPGDVIHADLNGALCIPRAVADQVYDTAIAVRDKEAAMHAKLRSPGVTLDTYLRDLGY
jgi:4-hydroxy-4-methyl-2-oxoglutarate aldolase